MPEDILTSERLLRGKAPKQAAASGLTSSRYVLRHATLDSAPDTNFAEWQSLPTSYVFGNPGPDPEWLLGYFEGQTGQVSIYSLYESNSLCGVAGFLLKNWPLKWHLGELSIATLPLRRFRLLDGLNLPANETAHDLLFSRLGSSDLPFDAIYMEGIPTESFLWRYLRDSELIRKHFLLYYPEPPSPHLLLRFEGSFEGYMKKFSPKHRKNLVREIKKIREGALGPMSFARFESPADVDIFLEQAIEVSRQTYQWKLHNRGLSATDLLRTRLLFAAKRGWMRCYLLKCGNTPSAFLVGYQHRGRFLFDEIGFDPASSTYSVGTVLQLLAIEDMFTYNRPDILDLGDYGGYKEKLSTESYLQGKAFLFKRGLYSRFLRAGHRCSWLTTNAVGSVLDRFDLKNRVKKAIRGLK